jgi:DNA-binding protein H-NS
MSREKAAANNRNDDRKRSMNSTRKLFSKVLIAAAGLVAAASMAAPAAKPRARPVPMPTSAPISNFPPQRVGSGKGIRETSTSTCRPD